MRCPFCGHLDDRVLDTRAQPSGESIRRRRECLACLGRFATVETLALAFPMIVKKNGRREPFDREKITRGIQAACQKRAISQSQIEQIVDRIAKQVLTWSERETPSQRVGEAVIEELRALDRVAYVRFASVYQTFADVREFVSSLKPDPDAEVTP